MMRWIDQVEEEVVVVVVVVLAVEVVGGDDGLVVAGGVGDRSANTAALTMRTNQNEHDVVSLARHRDTHAKRTHTHKVFSSINVDRDAT